MCKRISSSQWTRIILSFLTFAECFKFPNLFFLFLFILKCFQKVFKTFLGFFTVWYEMFTTTLQQLRFQWAAQSMTFSISLVKKSPTSLVKVLPFPSLHYPLPPREVGLWHIFLALPAMNVPWPADLKVRKNTDILQK